MKPEELFGLLEQRDAYYEAELDERGGPLSPLVVYSSTYASGPATLCHVGAHYVNFSRVEEDPWALRQFALVLINQCEAYMDDGIVLLAVMDGGGQLATVMGHELLAQGVRVKVRSLQKAGATVPARPHAPGNSYMLRRHRIEQGDRVIIVEDVTNTHHSVRQALTAVSMAQGFTIAIACAVARSEAGTVQTSMGRDVPVVSALRVSAPYHRQDEAFVARALKANMVEFSPRDHWEKLLAAQERTRAQRS